MQVLVDDAASLDVAIDGSSGDAVVLIHGFPLSREMWNAQAAALAPTHRVIRPNLRGVGASTATPGPYLMESLAADVAAVLDALGVERATIVGHSMGGYVALAFARMFSERVDRFALVCSRLVADDASQARARRELADRTERENSTDAAIDAYLSRLFASQTLAERPEIVESARSMAAAIDPYAVASMLRGMALRDAAFDIAPDLEAPMLMVAGGRDGIVGPQEARAIAGAFPRGRLATCEDAGHVPSMEEPHGVTEALLALLSEPV